MSSFNTVKNFINNYFPPSLSEKLVWFVDRVISAESDITNLQTEVDNAFGEMYIKGNSSDQAITVQSTWTKVVNFVTGLVNKVTFATSALTIVEAGKYQINWSASIKAVTAVGVYQFGVSIDGATPPDSSWVERSVSNATVGVIAGNVILNCSGGDVITLVVLNPANTNDILIVHANLLLHRID